MKTCTRCHELKNLEDFYTDKRRVDGRDSACKVCIRARMQDHYRRNAAKKCEATAAYKAVNKERARKKNAEWRQRMKAADPDYFNRQQRNWTKTPKGLLNVRAMAHLRRGTPLTPEAKAWWLSLENPTCHYCGKPANEIDHVIPIVKGGTGDLSNLVPACRHCNASKNDSELAEWGQVGIPAPALAS